MLSQNVFIIYYVILTQQLYFIGLDFKVMILQDLLRISNIYLVQLILGSFLISFCFTLKIHVLYLKSNPLQYEILSLIDDL